MAYGSNGLRLVAHGGIDPSATPPAGQISAYHYVTADSIATVMGLHYFNGAAAFLKIGDLIQITGGTGGTLACGQVCVSANDGTNVTVVGQGGGTALTDNTGGTVSTTLAAIAATATYAQADMVAAKNAIASLAAIVNKLINGTS